MYQHCGKQETLDKLVVLMAEDPNVPISEMANQLQQTEGEITFVLPEDMMVPVAGEHAQKILELLPSWGKLTTIVNSGGSIFEYKADFPKGKIAYGYYNLMGREGQLHGHLQLENMQHIAIVSKPFRGMESHYIGFFDALGECIFKVYLGRDKKRQLFPEQIEKLQALKKEFA